MCSSGDQTAANAEKSSAAFQDTLTSAFKTQFGQNQDLYNFLSGSLKSQINNPQGYGDQALTAMRTGATDTIASQYQNAQKALQNRQFTAGGENLPSGVNAMQTGALAQGQASDTAGAQNNITLQDQNLKQQNYWNAISGLNGVNQGNNAGITAGNANGAGNTTAGLSQAVTSSQAAAMSPFNALIGAAGGALTGGISKGGLWGK
jgi:hypothetical protein